MACRGNLGFYLNERDPAEAIALDRETMAETRRLGMRQRMLLMVGNTTEEARLTGEWDWALASSEPQLAGELDRPDRAWFLGNSLVLRGWRGQANPEEWAEWEALIEGHDDPQAAADYRDIQAVRALAERAPGGRPATCARQLRPVAGRPSRRAVAARAALWSGSGPALRQTSRPSTRQVCTALPPSLRRTTVQAGIAALDGRESEAVTLFRVAREGFHDIGLPWEEALVGIDMATLLDTREPEVVAAAERSREILTELRARPFLDRLEAALAVPPAGPCGRGATSDGRGGGGPDRGLTPRPPTRWRPQARSLHRRSARHRRPGAGPAVPRTAGTRRQRRSPRTDCPSPP